VALHNLASLIYNGDFAYRRKQLRVDFLYFNGTK